MTDRKYSITGRRRDWSNYERSRYVTDDIWKSCMMKSGYTVQNMIDIMHIIVFHAYPR